MNTFLVTDRREPGHLSQAVILLLLVHGVPRCQKEIKLFSGRFLLIFFSKPTALPLPLRAGCKLKLLDNVKVHGKVLMPADRNPQPGDMNRNPLELWVITLQSGLNFRQFALIAAHIFQIKNRNSHGID